MGIAVTGIMVFKFRSSRCGGSFGRLFRGGRRTAASLALFSSFADGCHLLQSDSFPLSPLLSGAWKGSDPCLLSSVLLWAMWCPPVLVLTKKICRARFNGVYKYGTPLLATLAGT